MHKDNLPWHPSLTNVHNKITLDSVYVLYLNILAIKVEVGIGDYLMDLGNSNIKLDPFILSSFSFSFNTALNSVDPMLAIIVC